MPDELDSFLKDGTRPEGDASPPSDTLPEAPEAHAEPTAPESASRETPPEDEPLPQGGGMVPVGALEKERRERNDWKSKAAAAEAVAKELRKQIEAAQQTAHAAPPQAAPPPVPLLPPLPDFNTDPQGYVTALALRQHHAIVNERLNLSEHLLRDKLGDAAVDSYVADFQRFAQGDPSLWGKLHAQATPYQWLAKEIDRRRMQADIGDDPAAYEAKLRAKWEAERGAEAPEPALQRPGLPRQPHSLAHARSVAGRASSAFTGPPPLQDLFPGVENRRVQRTR